MTKKSPYIIDTSDGSHSIYIPQMNETYHSSNGALTESLHVFVRAGLEEYHNINKHQPINIFEVGFGTGLNAMLVFQWAEKNGVSVNYFSIEQFPVNEDVYSKLNYGKLLNDEEGFLKLHAAPWNSEFKMSSYFTLKKINDSWQNYRLPEDSINVIFYDAFAPGKQPEMWNIKLLQKCYEAITVGGYLVTYCAKGQFKRDLNFCGFEVETLPGPPGKKEMVRALKK